MSSSITCPYCLEEIARRAHVCRHCHREVRLLLDALAEVEELKARLAAASPAAAAIDLSDAPGVAALGLAGSGTVTAAVAAVGRERWLACGALLLFYLLPAPFMVLFTDVAMGEQLPLALAVLTGAVLAYYGRSNLWMLAVYGFAQPFVSLLALVAFRVLDPDALILPLREPVELAVATALAGAGALLLFARDRLPGALTFEVPSRWLERGEAGLGTATNFLAAAAGLISLLVNLLN